MVMVLIVCMGAGFGFVMGCLCVMSADGSAADLDRLEHASAHRRERAERYRRICNGQIHQIPHKPEPKHAEPHWLCTCGETGEVDCMIHAEEVRA